MSVVPYLSTTGWLPIGPAPTSTPNVGLGFSAGRIDGLAPDPTNPDVMYVGGAAGGVWKTGNWNNTDGPPTWIPVSDDQPSLDFGGYRSLVVHPANHNLVLGAVSGPGAGILKSTNAGLGWQLLANGQFEGASLGSLAVHPTNSQILYLSVWKGGPGGGVYKSTDGGLNWQNMTVFHEGSASDVIVAKFDPTVLYAGLVRRGTTGVSTSGVYRSTDGGLNWTGMPGLPSSLFLGGAVRLESAAATGIVYVSLFGMDMDGVVTVDRYRTSNGGQAWTKLAATPGTPELRSWHLLLGVDPKNADHVFANDAYAIYESSDGGKSWVSAESIGDDWVNLTFDANNNAAVSADRNVYRFSPPDEAWLAREGNLQVTQFYDLTLDPQDPDVVYGVAQDHVDAMKFGGSILWDDLPSGGETGKLLVDPANSDQLYVSDPLDPANLVRRSTDGGQSWTTILMTTDFDAADYDLAYSTQKSFAMDPSDAARLLLGTTKVLETTDATAASPTWSDFSPVLSPGDSAAEQYITALAISANGQAVYAATADGHVWVKQPNKFWEQRDTGLFDQDAGKLVDLRIDPANVKRVFAVSAGKGGNNVWLLDPKTSEWVNCCGDLPTNLRAASIFVDWPYATPPLYVGTTRGVYRSLDLGKQWLKFGLYLPNTLVTDLQYLPSLSILAAGTFGRGAWEILIPPSRVSGVIFDDLDGDGIRDSKEQGIAGVGVFLDVNGNGLLDDFELRARTNARGRYTFPKVPSGTYTLRIIPPADYLPAGPAARRLTVGGSDLRSLDVGLRRREARIEADQPYRYPADLTSLPGRQPGRPVGAPDEFDRAAPDDRRA